MTIKNLTPHSITMFKEDGSKAVFLAESVSARCTTTTEVVSSLDGITITKSKFGETVGLPSYSKGTYYIVSRIVAEANRGRSDLLIVNETVRDNKGVIVGCRSLAVL